MTDPNDPKNPDPIEDVRKGLGLLFRAARSVVREVPKEKIEEAVSTGLREVGRAVESVASTIEREVFRGGGARPDAPPADAASPSASAPHPEAHHEASASPVAPPTTPPAGKVEPPRRRHPRRPKIRADWRACTRIAGLSALWKRRPPSLPRKRRHPGGRSCLVAG